MFKLLFIFLFLNTTILMPNYAEVNLLNGSDPSIEFIDITHGVAPIAPNKAEGDALVTALAALETADSTNRGWLVQIEGNNFLRFNLKDSTVNDDVKVHDKGVDVASFPAAQTALQTVLNSVVTRRIATGSNIIPLLWFVIRDIDGTNFKMEAVFVDVSNTVTSVDFIFDNFAGTEPIPVDQTLVATTLVPGATQVASTNTQTFDDPGGAFDEEYDIMLDFKDTNGMSVETVVVSAYTVQMQ